MLTKKFIIFRQALKKYMGKFVRYILLHSSAHYIWVYQMRCRHIDRPRSLLLAENLSLFWFFVPLFFAVASIFKAQIDDNTQAKNAISVSLFQFIFFLADVFLYCCFFFNVVFVLSRVQIERMLHLESIAMLINCDMDFIHFTHH